MWKSVINNALVGEIEKELKGRNSKVLPPDELCNRLLHNFKRQVIKGLP